jgi:hypothetical protein
LEEQHRDDHVLDRRKADEEQSGAESHQFMGRALGGKLRRLRQPRSQQRADYLPVDFTPRQNPFYVALPYNDLTKGGYKPEAPLVIPWFKEGPQAHKKSVCKGRWIAIRYKDRVAYAQWEDAGPFRTDHWQYVFGDERPKPNLNRGAGLDVSPAVRDFLGMNDTDVTDWKFVDFEEVPARPVGDARREQHVCDEETSGGTASCLGQRRKSAQHSVARSRAAVSDFG